MAKNSRFDEKYLLTDPRSSANQKQDKYKEKHLSRTAEIQKNSLKQLEKRKSPQLGKTRTRIRHNRGHNTMDDIFKNKQKLKNKQSTQTSVFSKNIPRVK